MADDSSILSIVSAWPGEASRVLEVFAQSAETELQMIDIKSPIGAGSDVDLMSVLMALQKAGLVGTAGVDGWQASVNRAELWRLAAMLRGADLYRRSRAQGSAHELVVSLPAAPSRLEVELQAINSRFGPFTSTEEAFLRIARVAESRLVVISPFINKPGFEWMRSIFSATKPSIKKTLVLRDSNQYTADLNVHQYHWIRDMGVSIYDYYIPRYSSERRLPVETYHAKIIIADNRLAYVGSANLLSSGSTTSLEAGVVVEGVAAEQVGRLVDGILRSSQSL